MSSAEENLRVAHAAHAAGRLADAKAAALRALAGDPGSAQANLLLGVIAGKSGNTSEALPYFRKTLELDPNSFEARFWLSMLYRREKDLPGATEQAEEALRLRPGDAHAWNNLGLCYMDSLRLEEAADAFKKAAGIRSDMAPIFHNLGTALYMLGRDDEAAPAFDRALVLNPGSLESCLSLGQVLISQTNPDGAEQCARRAISMNPRSAAAQLLMASALVENNRTAEAEKHMEMAIELDPQDPQAHALLGQRYQSVGRFEDANRHLETSLKLEPKQGFAYFAYVHNNKITEQHRDLVERMERLTLDGGLPPRELDFLEYGLGRSYESLKEYEKAMRHFDEANRLARQIKFGEDKFDRQAYVEDFDWLIRTFTKEFVDEHKKAGYVGDAPIVIFGMMRSGTTLAEQILSSHPKIGAAGEQRFWPASRPLLFGSDGRTYRPGQAAQFGRMYVESLQKVAPKAGHVTDKMPANYEMLGPIHISLPNARLIHMRRNPVDTCISIYATPNRVPIGYAYDKENIAFAYEQYLRLMDHWRSVLPPDRFLEVNYEDVVADRETQTRRMLTHIGLEWDDAVLHHEKNERSVNTPSLWQVRQPIYTTSVERWRRYEPWLGPFRRFLTGP